MQGVVPRFNVHPGSVWRFGPRLGVDTEVVYRDWLGLPEDEIEQLRADGVV